MHIRSCHDGTRGRPIRKPLSEETLQKIEKAVADFRAGRCPPPDDESVRETGLE